METWDAITSRRNVRAYVDRAIPDEDLNRILEAARRTPSSSNQQRWDFIVCTDRQQLNELSKVWTYAKHVASSAATIALIAPVSDDPKERESVHYDLGQATMSIMLAATDLGIGSAHSLVTEHDLARRILRLPESKLCAWLIALGYPADRPFRPIRTPDRRAFEDVVHLNHW